MSQSFFHPLPEFSSHTHCGLADHQVRGFLCLCILINNQQENDCDTVLCFSNVNILLHLSLNECGVLASYYEVMLL